MREVPKDYVIKVGAGVGDIPTSTSFSQMSMYERCPQQYGYRYLEGLVEPPNLNMALGTTFHDVVEVQHDHKIKTKKNLTSDDMQDVFATRWKRGHKVWGRGPQELWMPWRDVDTSDKIRDGKRIALASTITYHEAQAVKIKPLLIEQEFRLPFLVGNYVGYADVIHKVPQGKGVIDMKLIGRRYERHAAHSSHQLTSYAWAYQQIHGEFLKVGSFHCTIKKNAPEVQVLDTKFSKARIQAFLYWAESQLVGIHSGRFPGRVGMHCNWCGYQHRCPWHKGKGFVAIRPTKLTIKGKSRDR